MGIEPRQLYFIMKCLEERDRDDPINFVEIGVARGTTTRFLHEFLKSLEVPFNYFMLDTFSGFDDNSVAVEKKRFQSRGQFFSWDNYDYLNYKRYQKRVRHLDLKELRLIQYTNYFQELKDVEFDFVLLDVDLELATTEYLDFFFI